MVELEKDSEGKLVVIEPQIGLGESRTLFDSRKEDYRVDGDREYEINPTFSRDNKARLKVGVVHLELRDFTILNPAYFFVLSGSLDCSLGTIEAPGFVGPINQGEEINGKFKAIQINFWFGKLDAKPPQPIVISPIDLSGLPLISDPTELPKVWFTGSVGVFKDFLPGYNEIVHIGLGLAKNEIIEKTFHIFRDFAPQVVIPIPTTSQPSPTVVYDILDLGEDIVSRKEAQRIGAYEAIKASLIQDNHQRKLIKRGSLLLIINTMNPRKKYTKDEALFLIGQFPWLGEFEENVWEGEIRESERKKQ